TSSCAQNVVYVRIEALTADGGIYAQDQTQFTGTDGQWTLPTGHGLVRLVWTLQHPDGSAASCPTYPMSTVTVSTSLGGTTPCSAGYGYVPGQPAGSYDIDVQLLQNASAGTIVVARGSASIDVQAETITNASVVITLPQ
ncbi:MAG TPA: hypothetical protein VLT45_22625, partial [Kofleriaceae bacterium]|nr:hypothetical protein [Kofleriaceae bacterium]